MWRLPFSFWKSKHLKASCTLTPDQPRGHYEKPSSLHKRSLFQNWRWVPGRSKDFLDNSSVKIQNWNYWLPIIKSSRLSASNVRRDCLPIEALKDTQQMFMSLKSPMNPESSVRSVETIYTQIQYEDKWQMFTMKTLMNPLVSVRSYKQNGYQRTVEKSQTHATKVIMHLLSRGIWGDIWNRAVEKSQINVTNVIKYIFSGRPFDETFENAQWRKIKQMTSDAWKVLIPLNM